MLAIRPSSKHSKFDQVRLGFGLVSTAICVRNVTNYQTERPAVKNLEFFEIADEYMIVLPVHKCGDPKFARKKHSLAIIGYRKFGNIQPKTQIHHSLLLET